MHKRLICVVTVGTSSLKLFEQTVTLFAYVFGQSWQLFDCLRHLSKLTIRHAEALNRMPTYLN
jgi:hypothetical protein